jgi:predicted RNA polymerase sigma factor
MQAVAAAFRALGFAAAADACESTLEIFPDRTPPQDPQRRWEIIRRADFDPYRDRESIVYRVEFDALKSAIGAYIEQHPADFETVLP